MIILHVDVREPVEGETDTHEGHGVALLLPTGLSESDRAMLRRLMEHGATKGDPVAA